MRYSVTSHTVLTDMGRVGLWLVLGGLAAAFIGGALLPGALAEAARDPWQRTSAFPQMALAGAGSAAVIAGFALLIFGRQYQHDVRVEEPRPTFGPVPDPASASPSDWDRAKAGG